MACYKVDGGHAHRNSEFRRRDLTRYGSNMRSFCIEHHLPFGCTPRLGSRLAGATRHLRARAASSGPIFLA
jgi:hypothetical protein